MTLNHAGVCLRDVVEDAVDFAVSHGFAPPEERRLLDALLRDPNDARVVRRLSRRRRHGEPLGFGAAEVAGVLGPLLMVAVTGSVTTVTTSVTGSLYARLTAWLRRVPRHPRGVDQIPDLSRDQLRSVHDLIVEQLVRSEIPEATAHAVAERISGSLALGGERGRAVQPDAEEENNEDRPEAG
ncbi:MULTISPECIES: hypothetical protein [Streptomyces]|uniref:hypothetical protein n=1 Tax=Streptomyces TaxID=1883 RepID=UPI001D0A21BA|nr:hypothetical protein [Streptomyces longhuiensis]UDM04843.1 hypothetical protein LGI35_44845 [Streptomyces longhuiensis]